MIRYEAVFFDLDGTLLDNPMDEFLKAYFYGLWQCVADRITLTDFTAHLLKATAAMAANQGPYTNMLVFSRLFYPVAEFSESEIAPRFEEFYRSGYPALSSITTPIDMAPVVVHTAQNQGYKTVIATNPLFPETAIRQRINWAGLSFFEFELVTSYENCGAAKPSAKYYLDIAEKLDIPPDRCLMVGNEHLDMAAKSAGMGTYYIPDHRIPITDFEYTPDFAGSLEDLNRLLRE